MNALRYIYRKGENKLIQSTKSGLKFVQCFFRDGVEEMMRNASCFVILFYIDN